MDTNLFLIVISATPLAILYSAICAFWLKRKMQKRSGNKYASAKRTSAAPQFGKPGKHEEPQTIWAGTAPILSKGVIVEEIPAAQAERLSA